MSTKELLEIALALEVGLCLAVFGIMIARGTHRIFPYLGWLLLVDGLGVGIELPLLYFRRTLHLDPSSAYSLYCASNWILDCTGLVLKVLVVYNVFAEAMRPLSGLHAAGKIIFRWVAVVSLLVSFALLSGPGVFSSGWALLNVLTRLQQGVSVLTLCLLIFVCFAVRPLGLTFRSYLFGVSLGLGIDSTVELVGAAWSLNTGTNQSVYSPVVAFTALGTCVALAVWGVYFGLPEPARKMILLPTTSPFFFWNRISEILGDSPGNVAIAGFSPKMLAPAEIEMLTAATANEGGGEVATIDCSQSVVGELASDSPIKEATLAEFAAQPSLA